MHAGAYARVQVACPSIGGERGFEESAETTGENETDEKLWFGRSPFCSLEQANHRLACSPQLLDFERCVEIVCDREIRIDLKGTAKRLLRVVEVFVVVGLGEFGQ